MGKFNFDTIPNRYHTDCYKWDAEGVLPLWVADMDFEVAPCIVDALRKRVEHKVYGYNIVPESWREAYQGFYRRNYNWEISKEALLFVTGVVPALSSSVRALTEVGDDVVIFPPVYNCFYSSIKNAKRTVKEVPLLYDGKTYQMDFPSIEKAFASPKAKLCILCNPGNPTSRIWTKEELIRIAELAKKHHVIILSDEIHGPISRPGTAYQPFLTSCDLAKEVGYVALSVTKAFSLAGIQTAAMIIENPSIRALVDRQINTDEVAEPNNFATVAAIAALNEGEPWLKEMNEYVFANRDFSKAYIEAQLEKAKVLDGEATYLQWVDLSAYISDSEDFVEYLKKEQGLLLNSGAHYGQAGEGFVRINLATSRAILEEALERLVKGVQAYGRKQ